MPTARPFTRDTGLTVIPFLMDWPSPRGEATPPAVPVHPECADRTGELACQASWQEHLPHLRDRPDVYTHRCPYGKLCATVPVVFRNRCIAASKLVCYAEAPEDEFERAVEHLDALTEAFIRHECDWVSRCMGAEAPVEPRLPPSTNVVDPTARPALEGRVAKAIRHVRENLGDPRLRVNTVAHAVHTDPSHLSHLFSVQTGFRLGWFIMAERMQRAAELLLGPDRLRVQDIASKVGHSNSAWFSHAFRLHTGLTPTAFRRRRQPL